MTLRGLTEQGEVRVRKSVEWTEQQLASAGGVSTEPVAGLIQLAAFVVKEVFDDYLRCRTWDGTSEGATDINVAKPHELRRTPYHGKTIAYTQLGGAFSLTYTYSNGYTRTATKSVTESETQVIVPAYIGGATGTYKGEVIIAAGGASWAGLVLNPGPDEEIISWLDLNWGGRMWAKV